MNGIRIIATGRGIPSRLVTNDDLAQVVDTNDTWIRERTGIESRYFCAPDENGVSLSIAAAREALSRSGIGAEDIGACIVATVSPDYMTPSTACLVAQALGLDENIPSFDLSAACSGFLYSLKVAQGLIAENPRPYALIVGCEVFSRTMDFKDRSTCVLFGDGAGAVVVKSDETAQYTSFLGARGDLKAITLEGPGFTEPKISMDGRRVFRFAVKAIPHSIQGVLSQTAYTLEDMDQVVCHQANARIIDHVVKKLGADPHKFYKNLQRYGNTSAASIPIALDDMVTEGVLTPNMRLLCVGFGAGLTWGGCMISYGKDQ